MKSCISGIACLLAFGAASAIVSADDLQAEASRLAAVDSGSKIPESAPLPEIANAIGMKLMMIPAGEFMMGSGEPVEKILATFPNYDRKPEFFNDEFPQHRVRITKPFYFGAYEVTNGQFRKFVEATGYKTQAEREEVHPLGSGGWGFNQAEQKFEGREHEVQLAESGLCDRGGWAGRRCDVERRGGVLPVVEQEGREDVSLAD